MKKLVLFLLGTILLLGCTGGPQDTTQIVKALPQVQAFLQEHPNAQIKAVFQPKGSSNMTDIREKCGSQMQDIDMWYASVKEGNIYIETWLDGTTQKPLCAYKSASGTPSTPAETNAAATTPPATATQATTTASQTTTAAQGGLPFTLQAPTGWTSDSSGKFGTKGIWMGPKEEEFTININLMAEDVGGMDLTKYDEISAENAPKILTDYYVKDKSYLSVSGIPAKSYTHTFKQGKTALEAKAVFFILGGKAYSFTYTATPNAFAKYEPVFDSLIASVKVAGATGQTASPVPEAIESTTVRDDEPVGTSDDWVPLPSATTAASTSVPSASATVATAASSGNEKVKADCVALCRERKPAVADAAWKEGPCLSYVIAPGWVCDVAHSPRITGDDVQLNQCPMTLPENPANHFVEVDESCNEIRAV